MQFFITQSLDADLGFFQNWKYLATDLIVSHIHTAKNKISNGTNHNFVTLIDLYINLAVALG